MNTRTTGIVVLSILAIAFVASTVHYANKASEAEARCKTREDASSKDAASMTKMMDDQKMFAAVVTGDPGTVTVASARNSIGIEEPKTVRAELDALRAGRDRLTREAQALCLFAGANSIFYGDKLLTASNPGVDDDRALLESLGLEPQAPYSDQPQPACTL
jgi:hypothetical protein